MGEKPDNKTLNSGNTSQSESDSPTRFSRRQWLALTGTSLTAGLAGCPGETEDLLTETPTDTATPTPTASFQVSDLQPSEATAIVGDGVDVSATITNDGDAAGTQDVTLTIGGDTIATEAIELDAGASATFSTTVDTSGFAPGEYTHEVSTEDDSASGSLTLEEAIASFQVSDLQPSEATAEVGDQVDVSATITNEGNVTATKDVTLTIGGDAVTTESIELDAGGSATFSTSVDTSGFDAGEYTHEVATEDDSASGTLTLEAAGPLTVVTDALLPENVGLGLAGDPEGVSVESISEGVQLTFESVARDDVTTFPDALEVSNTGDSSFTIFVQVDHGEENVDPIWGSQAPPHPGPMSIFDENGDPIVGGNQYQTDPGDPPSLDAGESHVLTVEFDTTDHDSFEWAEGGEILFEKA